MTKALRSLATPTRTVRSNMEVVVQKLLELPMGAKAQVSALEGSPELRVGLMQIGIVPGVQISVARSAPFGGPLDVRVGGARLAIRRAAAAEIRVNAIS